MDLKKYSEWATYPTATISEKKLAAEYFKGMYEKSAKPHDRRMIQIVLINLWKTSKDTELRAFIEATVGTEIFPLRSFIVSQKENHLNIAYSTDGNSFFSSADDGVIRQWDIVSGNSIRHFEDEMPAFVTPLPSPNGRYIAAGSWTGKGAIWDIHTGQKVTDVDNEGKEFGIASFSPDSLELLTCESGDVHTQRVALWDMQNHKKTRSYANKYINYCAALSSHGEEIITGSATHAIVWDKMTGRELYRLPHTHIVSYVQFSPCNRYILTCDYDGLYIWDYHTTLLANFIPGAGAHNVASFSPDGNNVISDTRDMTISLYETLTGNLLKSIVGFSPPITSISYSPNGKLVLIGTREGIADLWEL